jgi:uncharacterized protein (DUF1800 family)
MGENTSLTRADARHLLRRTGFGARREEIDAIEGQQRGFAVDTLLAFKPKAFKPGGRDLQAAVNKWVKYMTTVKFPLQEKLVLFWHDHFATGYGKLVMALDARIAARFLGAQIKTLHLHCKGHMPTLVKAINKDAAMMEFLDTTRNSKEIPNENYARELQELFTLGVLDVAGNPNYAQEDIVQIARAFTGWHFDKAGKPFLRDSAHDFTADWPGRGPKEIFGPTRGQFAAPQSFTTGGEGAPEIDRVVDIIFAHRDSELKNTVARRTARRLIEYFAHPSPSQTFVDDVVAQSGFDVGFELQGLLREIFVHDDFYLSGAPQPWSTATAMSVKWPIDYMMSTLRLLGGMRLKSAPQFVPGGSFKSAFTHLADMGQTLLDPPSVFGWDWEASWISSATLLARYNLAVDIASARGGGKAAFHPDTFFDLSLTVPAAIVQEAASILGVDDHLESFERTVLEDYLTDNGMVATLNLNDYPTRNVKLHGLFALLLQLPVYQLH